MARAGAVKQQSEQPDTEKNRRRRSKTEGDDEMSISEGRPNPAGGRAQGHQADRYEDAGKNKKGFPAHEDYNGPYASKRQRLSFPMGDTRGAALVMAS